MPSRLEKTNVSQLATLAQLSADRRLDDVFEQYKAELTGTIYFLYSASESASKTAYEKLRRRCSRNYANSRIGDIRSWVFRVLYTLAFETVGNVKPKRRKIVADAELSSILDVATENSDEANSRARILFLRNVFLDLSFNERAVFLLRQNGDLSYDEIARTTGLAFDLVQSLMKKVILRLGEASDFFSETLLRKDRDLTSFFMSGGVEK